MSDLKVPTYGSHDLQVGGFSPDIGQCDEKIRRQR
jgi:hypothetical protein